MLAAELLLLLYLGAVLAPDSALGRWLIREPARALAASRRSKLAILAALVFLLLAAMAPELVFLVGLADLSLLADFAAIGLGIAAATSVRMLKPGLARRIREVADLIKPLKLVRRRRSGRRRMRPPRRDDGDDPEWVFALARV